MIVVPTLTRPDVQLSVVTVTTPVTLIFVAPILVTFTIPLLAKSRLSLATSSLSDNDDESTISGNLFAIDILSFIYMGTFVLEDLPKTVRMPENVVTLTIPTLAVTVRNRFTLIPLKLAPLP